MLRRTKALVESFPHELAGIPLLPFETALLYAHLACRFLNDFQAERRRIDMDSVLRELALDAGLEATAFKLSLQTLLSEGIG
jgi:hypothetical protein